MAPQALQSQVSLAAHARCMIQQAEREGTHLRKESPQPHICRVSRCGSVAGKAHKVSCAARSPSRDKDKSLRKTAAVPVPVASVRGLQADSAAAVPVAKKNAKAASKHSATIKVSKPERESSRAPLLKLWDPSSEESEDLNWESNTESLSPNVDGDLPASPSNVELTDSVLRKSQHLLKQLSELDLESRDKPKEENMRDIDSQSTCSQVSSCQASVQKQIDGMETLQVPVVFLKMLADMYEEKITSNNQVGSSTLLSSLLGTAGSSDDTYKSKKDRACHTSSRTSLASAASTNAPHASESESLSDSSAQSPQSQTRDISKAAQPFFSFQPRVSSAAARASSPPPSCATSSRGSYAPSSRGSFVAAARARSPSCTMSPRGSVMLRQISRLGSTTSSLGIQPSGVCGHHSVAPAGVSVSASVPPGSSVSITVTAPQQYQCANSAQSLHILAC